MTAALSALPLLAAFLAAWVAVSVLSAPVLVLCVRSRARANARMACRLERHAWAAAHRL